MRATAAFLYVNIAGIMAAAVAAGVAMVLSNIAGRAGDNYFAWFLITVIAVWCACCFIAGAIRVGIWLAKKMG